MDADCIESLLRSLAHSPSRRQALRLLVGSVFSRLIARRAGDVAAHDALLTCKKLKGDKKKCLKKARKHMRTHARQLLPGCTRQCAGKSCGDDGCGGSCGPCVGGNCPGGACICSTGRELCAGVCCGAGRVCCGGACGIPLHGTCSGADSADCCRDLECATTIVNGSRNTACCTPDTTPCTDHADCCSTNCDASGTCTTCQGRPCDGSNPCCALHDCDNGFCGGCANAGAPCSATRPCCPESGIVCENGYCGGCKRRQAPDETPSCRIDGGGVPCCDSDCPDGICASAKDGRCVIDYDCLTCVDFPDQCIGVTACVDGKCTV
jgi:hypothetical protein